MILTTIGICLIVVGVLAIIIGVRRLSTAERKLSQANRKEVDNRYALQAKQRLQEDISYLQDEKRKLNNEINIYYNNEKLKVEEQAQALKSTILSAATNYAQELDLAYVEAEKEFDQKIHFLSEELKNREDELNNLKNSLVAATQAKLREDEKKQQLDFYKLQVTSVELDDIKILDSLKIRLHQPVILSKLIWSTYFQKQTKSLCSRVLGGEQVICGIYKITDLTTEQCYVGQSVDIARRWTDHIKAGLGIDNNGTNKLYKSMQEHGVWNFSFELLEACDRSILNQKEKFFIDLYGSDKYGLNSQAGNK